jgi:NADH-quinone oxidoreductase subunit M
VLGLELSHGEGPVFAVLAAATIILGAWYLLTLLRRAFFGPLKEPTHSGPEVIRDLNGREVATLAPIALLCLVLGVYPQPFLVTPRADLATVAAIAQGSRERLGHTALLQAPSKLVRHIAEGRTAGEDAP